MQGGSTIDSAGMDERQEDESHDTSHGEKALSPSRRYQDVYPSSPLLDSSTRARPSAAQLLTLEYFEAESGEMPTAVFSQHHILLNLRETPHRVENWRDGEHRDFLFGPNEIIVTPAGVRSGWRWHSRSKVIVITLEPEQLRRFAETEAGVLLTDAQLQDLPQFHDPELCSAGDMLRLALEGEEMGSAVMYESLARIFLVKLLQRYGSELDESPDLAAGYSSNTHRRVLDYIERNYSRHIAVDDLAREARLSPSHFSRLFRRSLSQSPHQFLMSYRVERAIDALVREPDQQLAQVALATGFSDQAHFSRTFKRLVGVTPARYRDSRT